MPSSAASPGARSIRSGWSIAPSCSASYCSSPGFGGFFRPDPAASWLKRALVLRFGDDAEILGHHLALQSCRACRRARRRWPERLDHGDRAGGDARRPDSLGDRDDREERDEDDAEDRERQGAASARAAGRAWRCLHLCRLCCTPAGRGPLSLARTHEAGSISASALGDPSASRRPFAIARTAASRCSGSSGTRSDAVFSRHS